jgi:(2Fe-2S) ferredoxin
MEIMGHSGYQQQLDFNFEGQFLGFAGHAGKLKYLRLKVLSEEMQIKIPKDLRLSLDRSIQPGELLSVTGMGKFDHHGHLLKLKAAQITPLGEQPSDRNEHSEQVNPKSLSDCPAPQLPAPSEQINGPAVREAKIKPRIKVLVCQKSGCLKKGGRGLDRALQQAFCDRNIDQQVTIQSTGCLKRCSAAPNLVVMPGNRRYTEVRPKIVGQIVDAIAQQLAAP